MSQTQTAPPKATASSERAKRVQKYRERLAKSLEERRQLTLQLILKRSKRKK
jgi:hypothetical protein